MRRSLAEVADPRSAKRVRLWVETMLHTHGGPRACSYRALATGSMRELPGGWWGGPAGLLGGQLLEPVGGALAAGLPHSVFRH